MRETVKSAIKGNIPFFVMASPFIVYLFVSLFVGNNQLRRQLDEQRQKLDDQRKYYEHRLAADEAENVLLHKASYDHRKRIEKELETINSRLKVTKPETDQ